MTKRVLLVFGTRPEAIKMAPLVNALRERRKTFEMLCCVTAQHREMLDEVLKTFSIVPDFDLDLMRAGQDLTEVHSAVLVAMRSVLAEARPDFVLVHGDTTTTLAAALAAFYAGIPVGHVEAGLRSGRLDAPFPEEMNRRVADMIASYHFAPTEQSKANLLQEGCAEASILVTGNTVIDAADFVLQRIARDPALREPVERRLDNALSFAWRAERFVIVTCHRRESRGRGLEEICAAVSAVAERFPYIHLVWPVHPSPAVREPVMRLIAERENLHVIDPLPYEVFLHAMSHCHLLLTDSGGLQEESLALSKPVLVMREVTERPEAVAAGGARLVATDSSRIVAVVSELLTDDAAYAAMAGATSPFGDGHAAERIADFLERQ